MRFPVDDWQFWAVTGLFVLALAWIGRGLMPGARKRRKKRAALTVGGKPVERR